VLLALAPAAGLSPVPAEAALGLTSPLREPHEVTAQRRDFAYRDRELLLPGQRNGGRVVVPPTALVQRGRFPLLVVLHGLNSSGRLHPLLTVDDLEYDLVAALTPLWRSGRLPPFLIAAPTQSRAAGYGPDLWTRFRLDEFVDAVERQLPLGVTIDRQNIVLAGHSGAGCSLRGGLLGVMAEPPAGLRLVAAVDTCQSARLGRLWKTRLQRARRQAPLPFWSLWQPDWPRSFRAFERALGLPEEPDAAVLPAGVRAVRRAGSVVSVELDLDKPGPHGAHLDTLSRFVELVLPTLWPPASPAAPPTAPAAGSPAPTSSAAAH
jgi:predicted dienelactone hydrolase